MIRQAPDAQSFALLVSSVKDYAIFLLDPEGHIVTWNKGAQRIKGYTADEIIGRHFSIFYTDEARKTHHPQKELEIAKEKGVYEEEGWRLRKDGSLFWANVVITAVYDGDRLVGFGKVTRDLTERRSTEAAREKAHQQLQKANDEMQQLAFVISHELQEPIAAIKSYSKLLSSRYRERLGADADDFLDRINHGARMTARLVDDLWTYARVTKPTSLRTDVSTGAVLKQAKEDLKNLIESRKAEITHPPYENLPHIYALREQLLYVFKEVIANAIKHYHGPDVPRIEITVNQERGGWSFNFKDNGPGIDRFFAQQVFGIYQRLHGRPDETGTGMGLPICKKMVEDQHNGRIGFESIEGHGAKFFFWLPDIRSNG